MRKLLTKCVMVLIAFPMVGACRKDSDSSRKNGRQDIASIAISPANAIVQLETTAPGSQAFTATASFDDGSSGDVTEDVTWDVENPAVGAIFGSTLQIPGFGNVGVAGSIITASLGEVQGETHFTVVALGTSDLLFTLPHLDPAGSVERNATFVAHRPERADVFFLVDATESMGEEIANLQTGLTSTVVPGIRAEIADTRFGVGAIQDFPVAPYGAVSSLTECGAGADVPDQPFKLTQAVTDSVVYAQVGVNDLTVSGGAPIGCGLDWPEATIEALYQMSTGEGLDAPSPTHVPATSVGFRDDAARVVVVASDALSHAPGEFTVCSIGKGGGSIADYDGDLEDIAHTRAQAKGALAQVCAQVIGVSSDPGRGDDACRADADLEDFATTTGARVPPSAWDVPARPAGCGATQCCTGLNGAGRAADADGLCPLVFRVSETGAGLANDVVSGFSLLTRYASLDITLTLLGETQSLNGVPLPADTTTLDFLDAMTPSAFAAPAGPPLLPDPTFDATGFYGAVPDTELTYTVEAFNDLIAPLSDPQLFRARAQITDGCTVLDERVLLFLVQPP